MEVCLFVFFSPESLSSSHRHQNPFQCTFTDLFQLDGNTYMVDTEKLTGWMKIGHLPTSASSRRFKTHLHSFFALWGTLKELSTDGSMNLVSKEIMDFFKHWGVKIQMSSAHYPQLNGRAEAAKRMLRLNNSCSVLTPTTSQSSQSQYLNMPLRGVDKSPTQFATGHHLRDSVPTARINYKVDRHRQQALWHREVTMT